MLCSVCNSSMSEVILELNCGNLDGSYLYPQLKVLSCNDCGHIYNELSEQEIVGLGKYYNEEYAPSNIHSFDKSGDRPGSDNKFTNNRFSKLYDIVSSYIDRESKILDVGCAMGGFLNHLNNNEFSDLYGVDMTQAYIDQVKINTSFNIKLGDAENLPFDNDYFDFINIDQVLEHLINPQKAFQEASRVLKEGGYYCVGVPDAARYDDIYFFDYYWFLMREHIQHFDVDHLEMIGKQFGFEMVSFFQEETAMMSDTMVLPNLYVVFRLTGDTIDVDKQNNKFDLKKLIIKYVQRENERADEKRKIIKEIALSNRPVYVWGIGREFLYLYESLNLKSCNISGLIDLNRFKQNSSTVADKIITDCTVLKDLDKNSIVLITAIAHVDKIKVTLNQMNYNGEVIGLNI